MKSWKIITELYELDMTRLLQRALFEKIIWTPINPLGHISINGYAPLSPSISFVYHFDFQNFMGCPSFVFENHFNALDKS
jgi:hypothetical protein